MGVPVELTMIQADHYLPASALKTQGVQHVNFTGRQTDWPMRSGARHLPEDAKLPAVIYLHGCSGFHTGQRLVTAFLDAGYAVFAPNSFARPGREELCGLGDMDGRVALRKEEVRQAFVGNTMDHEKAYVYWTQDGRIMGKSKRGPTDEGTYRITDDGLYCRKWNNWRGGAESCAKVKRMGDTFATVATNESVRSTYTIIPGNTEGM